jgi:hypothetical protein
MKAKDLAELLMRHPDAVVCIEYIPYGDEINIVAEYNPTTNRTILEFENEHG